MPPDGDITGLLAALRDGDRGALDRLFPIVYKELRERAHRQLAGRRSSDTLSTTVLVHEAYLKLTGSTHQSYEDRIHFFAVASRAMRQILVDYARRQAAAKRGSGDRPLSLDPDAVPGPGRSEGAGGVGRGTRQAGAARRAPGRWPRLGRSCVLLVDHRSGGGTCNGR